MLLSVVACPLWVRDKQQTPSRSLTFGRVRLRTGREKLFRWSLVRAFISVNVVSLETLFSDAYHFNLPYYQRAYAWHVSNVGRLLADVAEAAEGPQAARGYCLGKVVLAKKIDNPETALVDGHQRLMTLSLCFAVLRDLEADPERKSAIDRYLSGRNGPRLSPQDSLADFCRSYYQEPGSTRLEPEDDLETLSETERNILENRNYILNELSSSEWSEERRRRLAHYLANSCCTIATILDDEDEAWRLLRVEEDTRLGFSAADCAKWSLLSLVPTSERGQCQKIWERAAKLLGQDDLHALLEHVRLITWRKRSERPVELDLARSLKLNERGRALAFFKETLLPHAERLADLRKKGVDYQRLGALTVAGAAESMRWVHPHVWVPAALLWLSQGHSDEATLVFFRRLERLVWMMRLAGFDPVKQQSRMLQVLGDIDKSGDATKMRSLDISPEMRGEALSSLRASSFDSKRYCARLLRRISLSLGQDPGPINSEALTLEHVLPKGFNSDPSWRKAFPSRSSVKAHAHTLGNLTFLTAAENHAADMASWETKRPLYARSKLVLANRLGMTQQWTAESIKNRTEELIRLLFQSWEMRS